MNILPLLGSALLTATLVVQSAAADPLTINSWGGSFQDLQDEIFFTPFETATDARIRQLSDGEAQLAKVKLQLETGVGSIDIIHGDASWLFLGRTEGFWADIPRQQLPLDTLYDDVVEPDGLGILYWSFNIVYNTDRVDAAVAPGSWADVWAYAEANPGRVLLWAARPNYVVEAALMADGVAMDKVYPLDEDKLDRAFAALDRIRDDVVWFETGDQGQRLLTQGEVDMGFFYGGDTFQLVDQGVPLDVVWDQGIYTRDYWLVVRGSDEMAAVADFLAFAAQPEVQARFAEATGYGPVNRAALDLVDPALADRLPAERTFESRQHRLSSPLLSSRCSIP